MAARSVVIATRLFAPEAAAAAFRLRRLALALREDGWGVRVLTTRPPHDRSVPDPVGVTVRRWPVLRDEVGAVRGYLPYLSFDLPLVIRLLLCRRPDLVVVEPPPTTGLVVRAVSRLRRVPYAYYAADLLSLAARAAGSPEPVVRAVRALESFALRGAQLVLAVSPDVAERVVALGVPAERVAVVGNGVDTEIFALEGDVERVEDGDRPYVVYSGTMSDIQGPLVFVEALSLLPADERPLVCFIGQGTHLRRMEERVRELGLAGDVRFLGPLPAERTAAWLRGARLALASAVPGTGYEFATPTKVYAAVGCGTPVLFAGPGAGESLVRDHGLGRAVPYDATLVAEALVMGLRDPVPAQERRRLAAWAHETVSLASAARTAADALARVVPRGNERLAAARPPARGADVDAGASRVGGAATAGTGDVPQQALPGESGQGIEKV